MNSDRYSTTHRYTTTAIFLHWLIAVLILCNLPLGLVCHLFEFSWEQRVMDLHKSLGITVLGFSLLRLGWRLFHRPPPPPGRTSIGERLLMHAVHSALYATMIVIPLSGWWITSAFPERHPIYWFGLNIPYLPVETEMETALLAHDVHSWLAIALVILATGHILAALRHRFMLRDGLFERMWVCNVSGGENVSPRH